MRLAPLITVFLVAGVVGAQVATYEGNVFPEEEDWLRVGTFDADRTLVDGSLVISVDLGVWEPLPGGEQDFYKRWIPEFVGPSFFVQWRCMTDAPQSEIPGVGGSAINSVGGGVSYHFTITQDQVRFRRDNSIPFVFVDLEPGIFHTYRVESYAEDLYVLYIDGVVFDSGVPEGAFPNADARIIWGAKMYMTPSTNHWDYVRYGTIPEPGSGDYDSDGNVDETDLAFFQDCLLGPDADGPGCLWADMNGDRQVNGEDIEAFVDALLAPPPPPPLAGEEDAAQPDPGVQSVNFHARPGHWSRHGDQGELAHPTACPQNPTPRYPS